MFFCMGYITACTNPIKNQAIIAPDTANYYPIVSFIAAQISYVDLRNFTIQKKTGTQEFIDSSIINKTEFVQLTAPLLQKLQNWHTQKQGYKETIFQDLGTKSYTINYTAISKLIPIQSIDILLNDQTNMLKRLFIKERIKKNDQDIFTQYNWIADQRFQINTSTRTPANFNTETKLEVAWNQPIK